MTSVAVAFHGTLTAGQVTTVTVTSADGTVEVVNRSGSAEIYFTVNGSTPTVGGTDCLVVPASVMSYVALCGGSVTVQLISSGGEAFSVIGGQPV